MSKRFLVRARREPDVYFARGAGIGTWRGVDREEASRFISRDFAQSIVDVSPNTRELVEIEGGAE